ncbi:sodium-dependent lysophosphatidylcholine symporter 1-B-like [Halichondria panicea]|uniref:sodium-dependent lysophosphatidylcholine symporter 1-B-like n=1 Tax=Halichondria panicea TaxID=6063 RepID=UPI00312B4499
METPPEPYDKTPPGSYTSSKESVFEGNTTKRRVDPSDVVPLWRKIAYATGSLPYSMCNTVVGFYLSIFLLEVAILDPTYVLIIVFSGRVWDAITDPVVGYLCSITRTRFGRLRPWMISAAVPAGLVYSFLWFVPGPFDEQPSEIKFIYYLLLYFAFQALLTCIHVPYTALTMHLSNDNKERDSVTLYRICFELSGTLLGILVYTAYFAGFVGFGVKQPCEAGGKRLPDYSKRWAYLCHAITLGVLIVIFILIAFLGVKEQKDESMTGKRISFFKGVREVFSFKPYVILLLLELFSWLAVQFVQGNMALYVKYSVGLEDQYPYVIAVLLVSAIAWMPFWQWVILKFGKKTAFSVGMWVFMPCLVSLLFVPFYKYLIYPMGFLGGMGVSCAYLLPWSMLPDVIDDAVLARDVRREELFYAYFVFGNKFAGGVTLGISTAIYKLVGYDETLCTQPWQFSLTLKLLVSVPPILFILLALIFLHLYPITEQTRENTKRLLAARRKLQSSSVEENYSDRRRSISITNRSQGSYRKTSNKDDKDENDPKQTFF